MTDKVIHKDLRSIEAGKKKMMAIFLVICDGAS